MPYRLYVFTVVGNRSNSILAIDVEQDYHENAKHTRLK